MSQHLGEGLNIGESTLPIALTLVVESRVIHERCRQLFAWITQRGGFKIVFKKTELAVSNAVRLEGATPTDKALVVVQEQDRQRPQVRTTASRSREKPHRRT